LLETFADQAVIAIENARLFKELQERNRDLTEALEQQTAKSEILRVIASSPTDIQPVLDTIAENAARLCDSIDAQIFRTEDDGYRLVASFGAIPHQPGDITIPLDRGSIVGRVLVDRQTIHIDDPLSEPESEYPRARELARRHGNRTTLGTPLLREGIPIGAILIRRLEVRPFSEKQISLLKTFADQAVIAIENVRLFQELKESLEQQTATSEILGVIASSPTDIQPVLEAITDSAARLCNADDAAIRLVEGNVLRMRAHKGSIPMLTTGELPVSRGSVAGRAVIGNKLIHIEDLTSLDITEFPESQVAVTQEGVRTILVAPLEREGVAIGVILIRRSEVRPFTEKQIALLKTFAAQAVIAIENVRLFQELKESLERQTATSEILGVIASSPTDIQPVLNVIAENAARLCDATDAIIWRVDASDLRRAAKYGAHSSGAIGEAWPLMRGRGWVPARAVLDRETIHVHDLLREVETEFPESKTTQQSTGARTVLVTPLLREGVSIGAIFIRRSEVRPFTEKQIALLKTFADQAVIAIENVRLFKELGERNRDLTEALEQQTGTGEVLRVIASSPTELQPVLDTLIANAVKLSGATKGHVRQVDGEFYRVVAHYGESPERISFLRANPLPVNVDTPTGRALAERRPSHILDVQLEPEPLASFVRQTGVRTLLAAPLLREGTPIGCIIIWREIVEPFTERQIELVKTFADQAVIAIENVRLFQELKESLEQQTATSEILGVIASSPTDIQPVLNTIAQNAARVCASYDALIRLVEGDKLRLAAHYGPVEPGFGLEQPLTRDSVGGRAVIDRELIHIEDLSAVAATEFPEAVSAVDRMGGRTMLAAPLLREGAAIGVIF
ncbi:MAG TPA: GAF domain-containing protein, partial [Blastocatellia bacterium]|nr:GAF domain-containing protein [Blastocatellia bacterium]